MRFQGLIRCCSQGLDPCLFPRRQCKFHPIIFGIRFCSSLSFSLDCLKNRVRGQREVISRNKAIIHFSSVILKITQHGNVFLILKQQESLGMLQTSYIFISAEHLTKIPYDLTICTLVKCRLDGMKIKLIHCQVKCPKKCS